MDLAADKFVEILTELQVGATGRHTVRRVRSRVSLRAFVQIVPGAPRREGQPVGVWLRDVSPGGIGFTHSQAMNAGDEFMVRLPVKGACLSLVCTVRHCRKLTPDVFSIGAEFVSSSEK